MSRWRIVAVGVVVVVLVAALALVVWAGDALGPMPEAMPALKSSSQVRVETEPWLTFAPVGQGSGTGVVIYPGGRVDPRSYAPTARAIAEAGHLAVIVPMPLNLAVLGSSRATDVMAAFPDIERWAIGGHSLGGAMAARYARSHADSVDGLVLWAAYPASGDSLSDAGIAVSSIYGTRDGLTTADDIEASRQLLPGSAVWVPIEGGNHAQFGWYGPQNGDNDATISRDDQQAQIVAATLAHLDSLQ